MPTVTYGHGYLTDCDSSTDWNEDGSPTLTSTSLTVEHGDHFKITGTDNGAHSEWVSPTSHSDPDADWDDEALTYDNNQATFASTGILGAGVWSGYLILILPESIPSEKLRFDVDSTGSRTVDVDVYRDGAWVDVYEGTPADHTWVEQAYTFGYVTQVRIRSKTATPGDTSGIIYEVEVSKNASGGKKTYWEYNLTDISADLYPMWIVRYKTSQAAVGVGAKVEVVYSDTSTEILFGSTPAFSTLWNIETGTLSSGSGLDVDKIRLYGLSDDICSAESVYYDFVLLHKSSFTLPNVAFGMEFKPPPKYAVIPIPARVGDITQNLGSESATVNASCDLLIGTWTRTNDYVPAEVFYDIAHNSSTEPWQWLTTGTEQFKVTLEDPVIRRQGDSKILDLLFREYRLSDASNETYIERFGLNL